MNFDRNWTIFALDAEVEAFGTSRIASAHNKLRAEVAALKEEHHFQACLTRDLLPYQERAVKAEAEIERLRALLRRVLSCGLNEEPHGIGFTPSKQEIKAGELVRDINAALGGEDKP